MLTEWEVIEAVREFLESRGYRVTQALNENQVGNDIVAWSVDGQKVMIEAKGETSSKSHTSRFGKPFFRSGSRSRLKGFLPCRLLRR
jgi:hypothetical protein